jgi:muramidase (phage lysozyme)
MLVLITFTSATIKEHFAPPMIDPAAYTPLLDTIAKGESKGNYNAYYSNAGNTKLRFTDMSVGEVLKWQENFVRKGSVSSAVGKYQIIRPTLLGLVKELKLDTRVRFDEKLQDKLAITLLERRGARGFIGKKLTREQFAANLAKEWAALPRIQGTNPQESYYAGDGLNKARISIDEVFKALATLENHAKNKQT